jgi:nucleolar protein 15
MAANAFANIWGDEATEDASPVAIKKQKALKPGNAKKHDASTMPVLKEKPKKATKKAKKTEDEHDATTKDKQIAHRNDDAGSSEDIDEDLQALAKGIDPEENDPAVDENSEFQTGQAVGPLPKAAKNALKSAKKSSHANPGVVYIGRIPHGFYEHEMRQYFSQFGLISRLRLSRNKKTGASKHFAFIEFEEDTTAEIVAKTMDNYLLFGHLLKCNVVPSERIQESFWKGANKRFKAIPRNQMQGRHLSKPLTESTWAAKVSKEERRRAQRAEKLAAIGYEFDSPQLKKPVAILPSVLDAGEDVKAIDASEGVESA